MGPGSGCSRCSSALLQASGTAIVGLYWQVVVPKCFGTLPNSAASRNFESGIPVASYTHAIQPVRVGTNGQIFHNNAFTERRPAPRTGGGARWCPGWGLPAAAAALPPRQHPQNSSVHRPALRRVPAGELPQAVRRLSAKSYRRTQLQCDHSTEPPPTPSMQAKTPAWMPSATRWGRVGGCGGVAGHQGTCCGHQAPRTAAARRPAQHSSPLAPFYSAGPAHGAGGREARLGGVQRRHGVRLRLGRPAGLVRAALGAGSGAGAGRGRAARLHPRWVTR